MHSTFSSLVTYRTPLVFAKEKSREQERIERLVARMEASVRAAFLQFVRDAKSAEAMRQVAQMLGQGDVEGALRVVDSYIIRSGTVLTNVFVQSGNAEGIALQEQISRIKPAVGVSFDPSNPRAAELMRRNRLEFIREMTEGQRAATRAALTDAQERGMGPHATARAFRDSIGLTERQEAAVRNYTRLLEAGSGEALDRNIRDRRYDNTVRRAARTGEPLSDNQIETMTDRYRSRYVAYRAETIARTETTGVVSAAREEAFRQTIEEAEIDVALIEREWRTVTDGRERHTHRAMNRQKQSGLETPFQSPSGAMLRYPGDPQAPASEVINCRCVVINRIKKPERKA